MEVKDYLFTRLEAQDKNDDLELSQADEERLRILANLIIDRMLEDYAKGTLKSPE